MTELLVESDQNLGINKIPTARPIFVLVPGLLNIIFSSNKNIPACKKSAPCGPIWPLFGPILPRLANMSHARKFLNSVQPKPYTEFWNLNSVESEPNTEFWNLNSVDPEPDTEFLNLNMVKPKPKFNRIIWPNIAIYISLLQKKQYWFEVSFQS